MATKQELTPMMKQFYDLKAKHPTAILLFRCGDFYETYEDDAKICADVLGITLTKRTGSPKGEGYMAGFPYHALDSYLPKIVRAGHRVAICDMLEDPKLTKKLVKRGITELTTTATNNSTDNNSKSQENMKLTINNTNNTETKNTVTNPAIVAPVSDHGTLVIGKPGLTPEPEDAEFEEVPQSALSNQNTPTTPSNLPQVQFSTYKTKKGDVAPQIIGFSGEDDPRYKAVKESGAKWVSAGWKKDLNGNKVYILLFGVRYMDVAKALAGAYNTPDVDAWHRAEDACMAIYEQAQRDGKARWEEKKQAWKQKAEEKKAQKAADEQAKRCYTKEDVASIMQALLNGGDVPEDIKALLAKVA